MPIASTSVFRTLGGVVLAATILFTGSSVGASSPPQPPSSLGVATHVALPKSVLNATFMDQSGHLRTLRGLAGKTVFLVPLLTLCGDTCPFTSGNLLQLCSKLAAHKDKNVAVVTISVDPYRDSVARNEAYARMIGASFEIWTPTGRTSRPVPPPHYSGKRSIGSGDTNAQLTIIEHFFGWASLVVKEAKPASIDWMAPHKALWYDISHSDGFWAINAQHVVRFETGNAPRFHGTLAKALAKFLNSDGKNTYKHPTPGGWTPTQALAVLSWVAGRRL